MQHKTGAPANYAAGSCRSTVLLCRKKECMRYVCSMSIGFFYRPDELSAANKPING